MRACADAVDAITDAELLAAMPKQEQGLWDVECPICKDTGKNVCDAAPAAPSEEVRELIGRLTFLVKHATVAHPAKIRKYAQDAIDMLARLSGKEE